MKLLVYLNTGLTYLSMISTSIELLGPELLPGIQMTGRVYSPRFYLNSGETVHVVCALGSVLHLFMQDQDAFIIMALI